MVSVCTPPTPPPPSLREHSMVLCCKDSTTVTAHLPASRAIAVAFVLEIWHRPHHPVIDLGQGQSLLGGALDGLRNEVCIGVVAPCVPTGRGLPQLLGRRITHSGGGGGGVCGGGRAIGGLLLAGSALELHGLRSGAPARLPGFNVNGTAGFLSIATARAATLVVLLFGDYVSVISPGFARTRLRTGKGPSTGAWPLLGLEIRVDLDVGGRLVARRLGHVNRNISAVGRIFEKLHRSHSINGVCRHAGSLFTMHGMQMSSLEPSPSTCPSIYPPATASKALIGLAINKTLQFSVHSPHPGQHASQILEKLASVHLKKTVSAGSERRSFTSVRARSPAMCIPQKENYLQLMPTHQLYHSAHSCHLDHFLLRSSLSSECCQSFEQCAAVQIPSRRGWLPQGPAASFKRGGSAEMCQSADPFPILAAGLQHGESALRI